MTRVLSSVVGVEEVTAADSAPKIGQWYCIVRTISHARWGLS